MVHKDIAVKVEHLTKSFQIPLEAHSGIKQKIINTLKGRKGYREFTPLNDISFEIEKGDFFGIVGRNGSGKSTLLKTLAGIYNPDGGAVHVDGTLVPFIELGVGFNPELTGRENVFLNGALLGFSHKQMEDMYDNIVDFAELNDFMEERLKNYSSGMQVRLAFSIAIRAEADILLLDEVLAVGDEAFQRKCEEFFDHIKQDKTKTVILVTHSMSSVRKYCNKAMLINEGHIELIGSPDDVASEYSLENITQQTPKQNDDNKKQPVSPIKQLTVKLLSNQQINQNNHIEVEYTVVARDDINEATIVADLVNTNDNSAIYCCDSPEITLPAGKKVTLKTTFDVSRFNNMSLCVRSSVRDKNKNLLAYTSESESPKLIYKRNDYADNNKEPQAGLVFKDGENVQWY